MAGAADAPLLLDTSVASLYFKTDNYRLQLYLPDIRGRVQAISFVTVGELYRWPIERRWGQKRIDDLELGIRKFVTLPWDESVARHWSRIQTETPKTENDAWIAACALAYGCILVADDNDFHDINGLQVISHFDEGR